MSQKKVLEIGQKKSCERMKYRKHIIREVKKIRKKEARLVRTEARVNEICRE